VEVCLLVLFLGDASWRCGRYGLGYVWEKENFVIGFDFEWICWSVELVCYKVPKSPRFLRTISFGSDGLTTWIDAIFRKIFPSATLFERKGVGSNTFT